MKKQYLVIGLGRFGSALAITLCQKGAEVLAVDSDMERVEEHRSLLTEVMQADAMDKSVLEEIGVENFDVAIVTMGSDIRSGGTITMLLKEMGAKYVIAKADDEFHGRMLTKLGADKVVFPERDMGQRMPHNLLSEKILDFIELSPDYSLMEMRPRSSWLNRPLKELDLRSRYQINIVAIRTGENVNAMPDMNTCIRENDVLLVVTATETLDKLD
ncbi:MAG: TrkA family potassium uptake protein [Clostridia bacterium]|nr:TrkA family potassium uptake protein [Clostridia bacterium]